MGFSLLIWADPVIARNSPLSVRSVLQLGVRKSDAVYVMMALHSTQRGAIEAQAASLVLPTRPKNEI